MKSPYTKAASLFMTDAAEPRARRKYFDDFLSVWRGAWLLVLIVFISMFIRFVQNAAIHEEGQRLFEQLKNVDAQI
ncbi:MAG: hypothetical protein WC966_12420 [Bradymonadales bacterium]